MDKVIHLIKSIKKKKKQSNKPIPIISTIPVKTEDNEIPHRFITNKSYMSFNIGQILTMINYNIHIDIIQYKSNGTQEHINI